jgi:hypothetical protein
MDNFLDEVGGWATSKEQELELEKFKLKYNMGMKITPRDTIGLFIDGVAGFANQIMEGDEDFFLNDAVVPDDYAQLGTQLRIWWPDLPRDRKDFAIKSFKMLLMLGTIATKNEQIRLVINTYRDPSNPMQF